MATVQTAGELKRLAQLTEIAGALRARFPDAPQQSIALDDIAKLCKALVAARGCRDCHDVRDQILAIVCLWDLRRDALEDQSDELLDCLTEFVVDKGYAQRL